MASPSTIHFAAAGDRSGEKQELGSDFEVGRISGSEVDVETDLPFFKVETNHPAVREKVTRFTHSKDRQAAQAFENDSLPPGFIVAEKENVAALGILRLAYQVNMQYPAPGQLALDGALELLAMRLVAKDTNTE
jgi:hypothetical protein